MRTSTGASYYYTTDALGSTILLTDSNQAIVASYTYDSWSNTTSTGNQAANNPWQYAGGYKDVTTGYTKFGARYYNTTIGRFTQPDPSGLEQNLYSYAGNDPINNSDPTGYLFWNDEVGYGCSPMNTADCVGVSGVPYPQGSESDRGCILSLFWAAASPMFPGPMWVMGVNAGLTAYGCFVL